MLSYAISTAPFEWQNDLAHPNSPVLGKRTVAAEGCSPFEGEKTAWHGGFDRYDFSIDDATGAITPMNAPEKMCELWNRRGLVHLCRNPSLCSLMIKSPPIDNLAPMARAGIPILHDCGSPTPGSTTRLASSKSDIRN